MLLSNNAMKFEIFIAYMLNNNLIPTIFSNFNLRSSTVRTNLTFTKKKLILKTSANVKDVDTLAKIIIESRSVDDE